MVDLTEQLSRKLSFFGFLCACMVVIDHVESFAAIGSVAWWAEEVISNGICQIAVPYFFVASGFFLAGHVGEAGWWRTEVLKRISSLLVPFVIWCVVGAVAQFAIAHEVPKDGWMCMLGANPFSLPFYTPMWFLRALFCLVLLSPILVFILRRLGLVALLFWFFLSIVLSFFLSKTPDWNNFFGNFIPLKWGAFWFSLGMCFRLNNPCWIPHMQRGRVGVASLTVGVLLVVVSKYFVVLGCEFSALVQKISIPFLLAGFWLCVPSFEFPKVLVQNAFPVYLVHTVFIRLSGSIIPFAGLMRWCFVCTIALLLSLASAICLRKVAPRASVLLFGGR